MIPEANWSWEAGSWNFRISEKSGSQQFKKSNAYQNAIKHINDYELVVKGFKSSWISALTGRGGPLGPPSRPSQGSLTRARQKSTKSCNALGCLT